MLRRKRNIVIYPEYFDKDLSRGEGRRVPKKLAARNPTVKKIAYACKKLGYDYEIEKDKAHPTKWWEQNGRVLIPVDRDDDKSKHEVIKELADIVRRLVKKKKKRAQKSSKKTKEKSDKRTPPVR